MPSLPRTPLPKLPTHPPTNKPATPLSYRTRMSSLLRTLPSTFLIALRALPPRIRPSPQHLRLTTRLTLLFLSMYASAALVRSYLLDYSRNMGVSMLPTIPAHGSRSVWSPLYAHGRGIKIGDIVQVKSPVHRGQLIGKRVVGLPGDYVLRDANRAETVGGARVGGVGMGVEEQEEERREPVMVQVPEGHVWLAGDNISWSRDSRFHGPVPMALIKAKTLWHLNGMSTWEGVWMEQLRKVEGEGQV